jgi:hypothetical protein
MAKQVQGSCNKCGHCGCYASPGGENEHWCPGIPTSILDWYLNHPDDQINKFAQYMVDRIGYTKGMRGGGRFTIPGIGRIDYWIADGGIQKSETDTSCPFFQLGTPNECIIFDEVYLHPSCRNNPQSFTDEGMVAAWEVNHPHTSQGGLCGYYWIDV